MTELKISKHTDAAMFSVRIDRAVLNTYDDLPLKTGYSHNKLIALAPEYARTKFIIAGEESLSPSPPDAVLSSSPFWAQKAAGPFPGPRLFAASLHAT